MTNTDVAREAPRAPTVLRDYDALYVFIEGRADLPFQWGSDANDCVSFAAGAVKAQTGKNALAGIPAWKSQLGAARALAKRGGFFEAVPSRLTEIPTAFAKRGDVALVIGVGGAAALMIVEGETLVGPSETGLMRLPRAMMTAAWDAGSVEE